MERFGDELRKERERRQVSMERVSTETKISLRHLQALEAGSIAGCLVGFSGKALFAATWRWWDSKSRHGLNALKQVCGRAGRIVRVPTGRSSLRMCGEIEAVACER